MDPELAKQRSRGISTDMSPEAVRHRLLIASDLHKAMRILSQAKPVNTETPNSNDHQTDGTTGEENQG